MVCLRRPYHIKFLNGCPPQISLRPFLNTLSHTTQIFLCGFQSLIISDKNSMVDRVLKLFKKVNFIKKFHYQGRIQNYMSTSVFSRQSHKLTKLNSHKVKYFSYQLINYLLRLDLRTSVDNCNIKCHILSSTQYVCSKYVFQPAITCSKLTIKTPERCHWRCSGVFIVNFEHISHLVLVFLLLTLSR